MHRRAILVLTVVALTGACSFDYEQATVADELSEEVASSTLIDFSQTVVRDGRPIMVLEAEDARTFEESQTVVLTGAHFRELDQEGAVLVEGWAERAVYHTDTENAEIQGRVILYSAKEETTLTATDLSWDKEGRVLRSTETGVVTLERDDGSEISGRGFEANFRHREIRFGSDVRGVVTDE